MAIGPEIIRLDGGRLTPQLSRPARRGDGARGALPPRPCARGRRHGRGVSGHRPQHRPLRGGEGAASTAHRERRSGHPFSPRGTGPRQPQEPRRGGHRGGARARGRSNLHRDGAARGRDARRPNEARRDERPGSGPHRRRLRSGARGGARQRRRPPGSEAGQHLPGAPPQRRHPGEGPRLRSVEGTRRGEADADRPSPRHPSIHVARAARRRARHRSSGRRVRAGGDPLRGALGGKVAVPREHADGSHRGHPQWQGRAPPFGQARRAHRPRGSGPPRDGQGARRSVQDRSGAGRGVLRSGGHSAAEGPEEAPRNQRAREHANGGARCRGSAHPWARWGLDQRRAADVGGRPPAGHVQ